RSLRAFPPPAGSRARSHLISRTPCGRPPVCLALAARSLRERRVVDHLGTIPSSAGRPSTLGRPSVGPNRRWRAGIALEQSAAVPSSTAPTAPRQRRDCLSLTLVWPAASPPDRKKAQKPPLRPPCSRRALRPFGGFAPFIP